ncbi:MAG: hypothetical protein ABSE80_14085, partial [Halobacteriota archaeon]
YDFLARTGARPNQHRRVGVEQTLVELRHDRVADFRNGETLNVRFENVRVLLALGGTNHFCSSLTIVILVSSDYRFIPKDVFLFSLYCCPLALLAVCSHFRVHLN